jgi:hypothetical protein
LNQGDDGGKRLINEAEYNMAQVLRQGRHAMGKVSIWAQWLMVTTGVLLSPVFVLFSAWFIGWPHIRRYGRVGRQGWGRDGGLRRSAG